jgi:hypothetical protein
MDVWALRTLATQSLYLILPRNSFEIERPVRSLGHVPVCFGMKTTTANPDQQFSNPDERELSRSKVIIIDILIGGKVVSQQAL